MTTTPANETDFTNVALLEAVKDKLIAAGIQAEIFLPDNLLTKTPSMYIELGYTLGQVRFSTERCEIEEGTLTILLVSVAATEQKRMEEVSRRIRATLTLSPPLNNVLKYSVTGMRSSIVAGEENRFKLRLQYGLKRFIKHQR